MSGDGNLPSASGQPSVPADGAMDEGRRYWKAAIAHLAPEKREAAWEFYLDRLESSAAADTLGGVMLLLEAHLAFFDDFPARLAASARCIETTLKPTGQDSKFLGSPLCGSASDVQSFVAIRKSHMTAAGSLFVVLCVLLAVDVTLLCRRSQPLHPTAPPLAIHETLPLYTRLVSVEPWNDPVTQRPKGCIVLFRNAAWAEGTRVGGMKVYLRSPVEEVRQNLEVLQSLAR